MQAITDGTPARREKTQKKTEGRQEANRPFGAPAGALNRVRPAGCGHHAGTVTATPADTAARCDTATIAAMLRRCGRAGKNGVGNDRPGTLLHTHRQGIESGEQECADPHLAGRPGGKDHPSGAGPAAAVERAETARIKRRPREKGTAIRAEPAVTAPVRAHSTSISRRSATAGFSPARRTARPSGVDRAETRPSAPAATPDRSGSLVEHRRPEQEDPAESNGPS